jgi:hypothetical protein
MRSDAALAARLMEGARATARELSLDVALDRLEGLLQ